MGLVIEERKKIARDNLEKADYKLENLADPNCKKCYGRGFVGYTEEGKRVLCKCASKKLFEKSDVPPVRH